MNKNKALLSWAATSMIAISALTGCGTNSNSAGNNTTGAANPSNTNSEPTLILATSADYKPYEYHDTTGGGDKIVGFDIDIANEIAKELHFKITIQDMDFDSLIGALQAKRADFVIAGMTPNAKRKKSVDFSNIYFAAQNTIVTKKGSSYTTLDALKGKKIAVQTGSIQEGIAKGVKGVQLDSITTIPNVIQEVKTGRADAGIVEGTVSGGYVAQNPDLEATPITTIQNNGSAIAFPKGSDWVKKFNTVIEKMKSDGEIDKLAKKWFDTSKK